MLSCPTVVHLAQTGQPGGVLYPVGQQFRVTESASRMEEKLSDKKTEQLKLKYSLGTSNKGTVYVCFREYKGEIEKKIAEVGTGC